MTTSRRTNPEDAADEITRLTDEPLTVLGRMPWSSNTTLLCAVGVDPDAEIEAPKEGEMPGEGHLRCIYKPGRGERELWDFPDRIYRREAAAYELSLQLGWGVIPPTVIRDGPAGEGSAQRFVEADFSQHYFTLLPEERHHADLRALALFDIIANNTDRKGGHVLVDGEDRIWGIDNGLSFHHEFKVRTVIWDFGGEPIEPDFLASIETFIADGPADGVAQVLDPFEREALTARATALLRAEVYPTDETGRRHPWPLV